MTLNFAKSGQKLIYKQVYRVVEYVVPRKFWLKIVDSPDTRVLDNGDPDEVMEGSSLHDSFNSSAIIKFQGFIEKILFKAYDDEITDEVDLVECQSLYNLLVRNIVVHPESYFTFNELKLGTHLKINANYVAHALALSNFHISAEVDDYYICFIKHEEYDVSNYADIHMVSEWKYTFIKKAEYNSLIQMHKEFQDILDEFERLKKSDAFNSLVLNTRQGESRIVHEALKRNKLFTIADLTTFIVKCSF